MLHKTIYLPKQEKVAWAPIGLKWLHCLPSKDNEVRWGKHPMAPARIAGRLSPNEC